MINKLTEIGEKRWVSVTEYPDGTLSLEGIQPHPMEDRTFLTTRIRFSKEAIKELIPMMQEWLDNQ